MIATMRMLGEERFCFRVLPVEPFHKKQQWIGAEQMKMARCVLVGLWWWNSEVWVADELGLSLCGGENGRKALAYSPFHA